MISIAYLDVEVQWKRKNPKSVGASCNFPMGTPYSENQNIFLPLQTQIATSLFSRFIDVPSILIIGPIYNILSVSLSYIGLGPIIQKPLKLSSFFKGLDYFDSFFRFSETLSEMEVMVFLSHIFVSAAG